MARTWSAVLARLGVPTGDGRTLAEGGGSSRDLPLPLMYQNKTDDGHGGSVIVGRIESLRIGDGMVTASGSMLPDQGWQAEEMIAAGVIGPSVDLDDIEYVMADDGSLVITKWRVAGATLVAIPAFADVSITLDPEPVESRYQEDLIDAVYGTEWGDTYGAYTAKLTAFASTASIPSVTLPPAVWFARPDVDRLTPLTVTDTGRVFGHVAAWDSCHVGLPGCVTPPASMTGYSYFHVGSQRVMEGMEVKEVPVGTLTVGGGHADASLGFRAAAEHYDDVGAAVARVQAGEDEFGIWVAGWMLPEADPVRRDQFMASPVSGDWRRIGGALEMIAVCSVNTPGFPVPRARVAFSHGAQTALIGTFGIQPVTGSLEDAQESESFIRTQDAEARARWAWQTRGH